MVFLIFYRFCFIIILSFLLRVDQHFLYLQINFLDLSFYILKSKQRFFRLIFFLNKIILNDWKIRKSPIFYKLATNMANSDLIILIFNNSSKKTRGEFIRSWLEFKRIPRSWGLIHIRNFLSKFWNKYKRH